MPEETKNYEIGFLASSQEAAERVLSILSEKGAGIISRAQILRIALAYPIRSHESAHFGSIVFSANAGALPEIERTLRMSNEILRHMVISHHEAKESGIAGRFRKQGDEIARPQEPSSQAKEPAKTRELKKREAETVELTNEALEKKLEEILR